MPKILLVDDDETIRDTLYELLSQDYFCQTAETAEKAFARLEADGVRRRAHGHLNAGPQWFGITGPRASEISRHPCDNHFRDRRSGTRTGTEAG